MNKTLSISLLVVAIIFTLQGTKPNIAHADTIMGTPDDTPGVFLFSAGSSSDDPQDCLGDPRGEATNEIIETAYLTFEVFDFIGASATEIQSFDVGSSSEGSFNHLDRVIPDLTEGLFQIDDFGIVSYDLAVTDDFANYDAGIGGRIELTTAPLGFIQSDRIVANGMLGSATPPTTFEEAVASLGGFDLFIFEDADLSGMVIEILLDIDSPTIPIIIEDAQINPNTKSGGDDTLIAIDLDSLPGWFSTDVVQISITDNGVPYDVANDPCVSSETSLEIDAVAVIANAPTPPTNVNLQSINTQHHPVHILGLIFAMIFLMVITSRIIHEN